MLDAVLCVAARASEADRPYRIRGVEGATACGPAVMGYAMTPHEYNTLLTVILIGLPLAIVSHIPWAIPAIVILGLLWLCTAHPTIGVIALVAVVTHRVLGWAIKDYFLFLIGGFGLRASGALNSAERAEIRRERFEKRQHAPRQPRSRGRRPPRIFPVR
jgi:hypothetical protein